MKLGSRGRQFGVVLALAATSCSGKTPREQPEFTGPGALPAGVIAQVGRAAVRAEGASAMARDEGISLVDARDALVHDALFAEGARERGADREPEVRAAIRGALSRVVLAEIVARARSTPPTDAEVDELTRRHFYDLDRPEGFRVVHAVVRNPKTPTDDSRRRARHLAEDIARAVAGAPDSASFRSKAEAVPRGDLEVKVEELPPVAADGRVLDEAAAKKGSTFDPSFVAAAARLTRVGEQSGVVESPFGFHVMMLLEKTPEHRVPLEERRALLHDEVVGRRSRQEMEQLSQRLRAAYPVTVERSADSLLSEIGAGAAASVR